MFSCLAVRLVLRQADDAFGIHPSMLFYKYKTKSNSKKNYPEVFISTQPVPEKRRILCFLQRPKLEIYAYEDTRLQNSNSYYTAMNTESLQSSFFDLDLVQTANMKDARFILSSTPISNRSNSGYSFYSKKNILISSDISMAPHLKCAQHHNFESFSNLAYLFFFLYILILFLWPKEEKEFPIEKSFAISPHIKSYFGESPRVEIEIDAGSEKIPITLTSAGKELFPAHLSHLYSHLTMEILESNNESEDYLQGLVSISNALDVLGISFYKNDKLIYTTGGPQYQRHTNIEPTTVTDHARLVHDDIYQYLISCLTLRDERFCLSMAFPKSSYVSVYLESDFHKYILIALAIGSIKQSNISSERSLRNYSRLISKAPMFSVTERFKGAHTRIFQIGSLFASRPEFRDRIYESLDEDDRPRFKAAVDSLNKGVFHEQFLLAEQTWVSICGLSSYDETFGKTIQSFLMEDVTQHRNTDAQIKEASHDMDLASNLLGLHKYSYDTKFRLANQDLFLSLGYTNNHNLQNYVSEEDYQAVVNLPEGKTVTIRIKDSRDEYKWFTAVCTSREPVKGFLFSVNEVNELQSTLQSTRNCFQIGSDTNQFAFWSIPLVSNPTNRSVFVMKPYTELVYSVYADDVEAISMKRLKAIEAPTMIEARCRFQGTEYQWFSLNFIPTSGQQLLCFAFNVDQRRKAQDLLKRTEELLNMALTYTNVHLWEFINQQGEEQVLTYEPTNTMIMDWNTLEHNLVPEYQEKVLAAFKDALAGRSRLEIEVPFFFDTLHWLLMRGLLVNGKRLMGIYLDMTSLKEASHEVEIQKARAEEASAAKSRFLANMSHEIRTPLNGLCGLLEILLSSELTDEQRELGNCIYGSFIELTELLNDTLDLAKIESDKLVALNVSFDPSDALSSLQDLIFVQKRKPGVEFLFDIAPDSPVLYKGDPHCLTRAISNLLSNAAKFTEAGSITIRIECVNEEALRVYVIDTGCGMGAERVESIREHIQHGEMMAVYENGCVGIGLSLVREMVKFMGGTLEVESEVGKGSQFAFMVPFEPIFYALQPKKSKWQKCYVHIKSPELVKSYCKFYKVEVTQKIEQANLAIVDSLEMAKKVANAILVVDEEVKVDSPSITVCPAPLKPHILRNLFWNSTTSPPEDLMEGMKVLVADDNPTNQFIMKKMLDKMGCNVKIVANGAEAVSAVEEEVFDITLMDQQMPILDGPGATREIRSKGGRFADMVIVGMTASTLAEDEEECRRSGMNGFITKPVTMKVLQKALASYQAA